MTALHQPARTAGIATTPRRAGPVLALDIGGTKLAVAVVTADGATHGLLIEPTHRERGPEPVLRHLLDMGHRAIAASGVDEIAAVGLSCGGPLDAPSGVVLSPPHLPGWIDIPLGRYAADEFGVPFALENDATAAALGEHRFGAGRGVSTMVYLTISTGVGGGAVIDGRLHRGAAGNGGELGHVTVRRDGRLCSCGRRGCVEAYASGTSIAERAREALAEDGTSSLATVLEVTAADVAREAAAGDHLAARLWAETVDLLGAAVTDLVNVLEPELVVLGGGVTRSGAMLLDPVRRIVHTEAMGPAAAAVRVEMSALGDAVCVVGAGAVALDAVAASVLPTTASAGDLPG